jgi:hypothetical protein
MLFTSERIISSETIILAFTCMGIKTLVQTYITREVEGLYFLIWCGKVVLLANSIFTQSCLNNHVLKSNYSLKPLLTRTQLQESRVEYEWLKIWLSGFNEKHWISLGVGFWEDTWKNTLLQMGSQWPHDCNFSISNFIIICIQYKKGFLLHNPTSLSSSSKCQTFSFKKQLYWEPGSSVSIVSGYRLDDQAIKVWSPAEAKGFFL